MSRRKLTRDEIITQFKQQHGNKYNYSKMIYEGTMKKVEIICPYHGSFWQSPDRHKNGDGCPKCGYKRQGGEYTQENIIKLARKVHGDEYDYSKLKYQGMHEKIIIICPKHGEFRQSVTLHIHNKAGCPQCAVEELSKNKVLGQTKVIEQFREIHGDFYDYSKVEYKGSFEKVTIICPKHGEFKQTPFTHKSGHGCPQCKRSTGEEKIALFLNNCNINYTPQCYFKECKNKRVLPFDFYLPDYNMCIEYDGELHTKAVDHFGGTDTLSKTQINDEIKNNYCKNNDIRLIRISYKDFQNIESILKRELNI